MKSKYRIYERGVGPTTSSGTGTCASGSAAIALRGADSVLRVVAPGGPQSVQWNGGEIVLTGPANLISLWRSLVKLLPIPAVRRGAKINVISPASYPQPDRLAGGVEALTRLGYLPAVGKHALSKAHYYFAGTDPGQAR